VLVVGCVGRLLLTASSRPEAPLLGRSAGEAARSGGFDYLECETLAEQGKQDQADELRERLAAIDEAIAQNDYRTANIRAGYVYVISNIGSFGEKVVKIGLTRRLEPRDRIVELGDASVPFPFDTHLLHFSEDAVALENELHKIFADRRLNHVNLRREFFFSTPQEIRAVLAERFGNILEFNETPEAMQYFQSRSAWPQST
jgi:hypothetical protein